MSTAKRTIMMCAALALSRAAHGQWVEQTLELTSGWNAVFLRVEPAESAVESVLADLDVESVWAYLPDASSDGGRWVAHFPGRPAFLQGLFSLESGRGYLIKASRPGTLRVLGRAVHRGIALSGGAYTLFGAAIDPSNPPSFDEHFAHPSVLGKIGAIVELSGDRARLVPSSERLAANRAVFVLAERAVDTAESGPIVIDSGRLLRFSTDVTARALEISVPLASATRRVTARALPSAEPPEGEPRDGAGGDASWVEFRDADGSFHPLSEGATFVVPPGETTATLPIRVVAPAATATTSGPLQAVLEIADERGNRAVVGAFLETETIEGVWVGQAVLDRVATQSAIASPPALEPAEPLALSLILDIGAAGSTTSARLLDELRVTIDRDGRPLERRLSAVLFDRPIELAGSIDAEGRSGALTGTTSIAAEHPLNPYRHRFHPEHGSGFTITRDIALELTGEPVGASDLPTLADLLGGAFLYGEYEERISGLSVEPIVVRGTFRLRRLRGVEGVEQ